MATRGGKGYGNLFDHTAAIIHFYSPTSRSEWHIQIFLFLEAEKGGLEKRSLVHTLDQPIPHIGHLKSGRVGIRTIVGANTMVGHLYQSGDILVLTIVAIRVIAVAVITFHIKGLSLTRELDFDNRGSNMAPRGQAYGGCLRSSSSRA